MGKKIRDTIHGYIYVTKIEEAVSQHPLFLRLHHVHQTSFTYLTYPNAHSTRYPHSLGVMHVAGEILSAAFRNSKSEIALELAQTVQDTIKKFDKDFAALAASDKPTKEIAKKFSNIGNDIDALFHAVVDEALSTDLLSDPIYAISGRPRFEPSTKGAKSALEDANVVVPLVLLYQATRLAALLHDIGHPPFSHIVEYALLDTMRGRYRGHEPRGLDLVDAIIGSEELNVRKAFISYPIFSRVSLYLCRYILENEKNSPFFGIKKSLLDGPIDADRLDYVRRDAYSAGLVPTYDIRRLVDAAFLRHNSNIANKPGIDRIEIGYQPNCLSAFENFFVARYDLYRWMIYHHDVARRNLAIQRAVKIIVDQDSMVSETIKSIGAEFCELAIGSPKGYRRFTDSYMLDKLWIIYENLEDSTSTPGSTQGDLRFFLDIVLSRRNDLLRTFLKRPDGYAEWVSSLGIVGKKLDGDAAGSLDNVKQFNAMLTEKFQSIVAENSENVAKGKFAEELEGFIREAINGRDQIRDLRVYAYYIGTFQAGPDKPITAQQGGGGELFFSTPSDDQTRISVRSVSPTLAMLQEAWAYSPQLLLFYTHPVGARLDEKRQTSAYAMLRESVRDGLRKFLGHNS